MSFLEKRVIDLLVEARSERSRIDTLIAALELAAEADGGPGGPGGPGKARNLAPPEGSTVTVAGVNVTNVPGPARAAADAVDFMDHFRDPLNAERARALASWRPGNGRRVRPTSPRRMAEWGEMRAAVLAAYAHHDGQQMTVWQVERYVEHHRPPSLLHARITPESWTRRVAAEMKRMRVAGILRPVKLDGSRAMKYEFLAAAR